MIIILLQIVYVIRPPVQIAAVEGALGVPLHPALELHLDHLVFGFICCLFV